MRFLTRLSTITLDTGVDLSKILGANKILGRRRKNVSITDETIGLSQLLGACAPAAPTSLRLQLLLSIVLVSESKMCRAYAK